MEVQAGKGAWGFLHLAPERQIPALWPATVLVHTSRPLEGELPLAAGLAGPGQPGAVEVPGGDGLGDTAEGFHPGAAPLKQGSLLA